MGTSLHDDLLAACEESVRHQVALIALLARSWEVAPTDVYYRWCLQRSRSAIIDGTRWRYFFHGLECDITHQGDGRFVRNPAPPLTSYQVICGACKP